MPATSVGGRTTPPPATVCQEEHPRAHSDQVGEEVVNGAVPEKLAGDNDAGGQHARQLQGGGPVGGITDDMGTPG